MGENYEKYNLTIVNEIISSRAGIFKGALMYYIENDFKGTVKERRKLFMKNNLELRNFLSRHKKIINSVHLYLLGYLYNNLGFENKDKIKEVIRKAVIEKQDWRCYKDSIS